MSLTALAFRFGGPFVRCFPGAARLGALLASRVAWRLRSRTRRRVVRNLLPACNGNRARAVAASRKVFERVTAYYIETLSLQGLNVATFEADALDVIRPEYLAALDSGGPLIVVSAHTGNPELAIQGLLGRKRRFVAIVEPLADRSFARHMLKARRSAGGDFVEATPAGLLHAVRALKRGSVLGLMGDRDIQGNGVCVSLLGREVRLPRGPWEIAQRTGSIVLPGFCSRLPGRRLRVTFEEPFKVEATGHAERDIVMAAQRWASLFESHLRADPGQWVLLEDFWANHACGGRGPA